MFPLFGLFGALASGITAAQAVGGMARAQGAPRPMSDQDIENKYDERIGQATSGTRNAAMSGAMSLARSGSGTGGGRASAMRAAMMQMPEAQAQATQAGFGAGAGAADSELKQMQVGHALRTDRHWRPQQEAERASGAIANQFSDMSTSGMMMSDERSKQEIQRLTGENESLRAAMDYIQRTELGMTDKPPPNMTGGLPKPGGEVVAGIAPSRPATPAVIDLDAIDDPGAPDIDSMPSPPLTDAQRYMMQKYDPDILHWTPPDVDVPSEDMRSFDQIEAAKKKKTAPPQGRQKKAKKQ